MAPDMGDGPPPEEDVDPAGEPAPADPDPVEAPGPAPARTRTDGPRRRSSAPPARRPSGPRRPAASSRPRTAPAEPRASAKSPGSQKKLVVILSVLTVAAVALAAFAVVLSSRSDDDPLPPPAGPTAVPVTKFTDRQTGFTVEYPRSWRQVNVPNAEYRLAVDGGNNVAMTIRVVPVAEAATPTNLQNFKTVTDGFVALNDTVTILKQQAVTYNGMLGYYYFYTFQDGAVEAVHAHYFLFSGKKMNIIVFQSFPDDFERTAATFDAIAESFRSDPNVELTGVAPVTTPTTVR